MTVSLMPQRPPFVHFEQRAVEDRNASIKAGGLVMRDEDFVVVMQPGSKDTVEKLAVDWLAQIDRAAANGTFPPDWAVHFRKRYDSWKEGRECSAELGLPLREWPSLSKAQCENLIAAGCRTVEDVAAANEQILHRVGMGARELQQKARNYLASRDANKAAEEITALKATLTDRDERIAALEQRLAALEAKKRA